MDYNRLNNIAIAMLKKNGVTVTIERNGSTLTTGFGVFVASKAANEAKSSSSVLAATSFTKRTLLLSGNAAPVNVGDFAMADGSRYKVHAVERVRPASTTVLYKLEVS